MSNEMDNGGYVRLYRKLLNSAVWTSTEPHNERSAWVHILLSVRWGTEPTTTMVNGRIMEVRRGESVKSLDTWARELGWNKSKVRRYFNKLKKLNQIDTQNEHKTTRLTICNFDTYQSFRHDADTDTETQSVTVPTRNRHVTDTMPTPEEEGKNSMKEKKGKNEGVCAEPHTAAPAPPPVMVFPVKTGDPYQLTPDKLAEYRETFDVLGEDAVLSELKKARQWLIDNPSRRKTTKGVGKFLTHWLSKSTEGGRNENYARGKDGNRKKVDSVGRASGPGIRELCT
jgi:hypothetical protein